MVFLHLWRQCGVSHEVQRGIHGASLVVSGKSGLHSCCEGELGIALESRQSNLAQDTLKGVSPGLSRVTAGFSSYDGEFRMPLVLAHASPIFHSSCEGKLGIALE